MNPDHDFFQVWKFSEDPPKKANGTLFFPSSGEDQKKRCSSKIEHFFPPNLRSDVHLFKLLEGCRCGPFSNYWGGYSQIIGEDISPHPPPCFGTPGCLCGKKKLVVIKWSGTGYFSVAFSTPSNKLYGILR